MNMSSAAPSQKVTAGFVASTGVAIVLALLNHYALKTDPLDGFMLAAIPAWVGSAVSYFVPPSSQDVATAA
jgi:hypothetical protein